MSYRRRTGVTKAACGAVLGLIGLALVTATPADAQQAAQPAGGLGNGSPNGFGNQFQNLILNQTPELSSLALFGTGAAGMGAYALARLRAGRHRR